MQGMETLKEEQCLCLNIKPYFSVEVVSQTKEEKEDFLTSLVKLDIITFSKLFYFLNNIKNKIKLKIKLSSTNLISLEQLKLLSELKNIDYKFIIDDSFEFTCFDSTENIYTIDEMIEIKMMINKILENIPRNLTVDKKIQYIYKNLGKKIQYDDEMNRNKEYKKKVSSKGIYRVLKENKGVCECIAQTFRNIMLELGEECRIIRSETHSWNIIKKNNRWYHLDLTWDLDNIKDGFYLQYFFKGQNRINKDHEHDYIIYIDKDMEMSKRSLPYSYSKR